MCGIFCSVSKNCYINDNELKKHFIKIKHRGPDSSVYKNINNLVTFGFHRLAIVDPDQKSNQPLELENLTLICNGEIFNHSSLEKEFKLENNLKTNSDCEIILHLYHLWGGNLKAIKKILERINAEFAFILYDKNINKLFIARDSFGVRPLFWGSNENWDMNYFFSSELKSLGFLNNVEPFPPGYYMEIDINEKNSKLYKYYKFPEKKDYTTTIDIAKYNINNLLKNAVDIRLMSDRPVGCFLSGGLDSSLVTALVHKNIPNINCFSIGLEGGVDIEAAKKVVKYLGIPESNHHIVNFTVEQGFNCLKDVIYHLESYDITTIRASIPQYLLSKYIKENTDIVVLYSGEGSDELFCGYQYSKLAPSLQELEKDSKKLLSELYMFDNLRVDRTTAAFGLEVRIPFLDPLLVNYVLGLPTEYRSCNPKLMEKTLLRYSFKNDKILPNEILYRHKEAFSDAVSSTKESWYLTLTKKYIEPLISDSELLNAKNKYPFNTPNTKEALYYRNIFTEFYPNRSNIISHIWLPNWTNTNDPSATVLECHKGDLKVI
jgi:asparagine synthase (glutamine-hydrolysing)